MTVGFFGVMCLCALVAAAVLSAFPRLQVYMRIAGSLYIAWLAVHIFLDSFKADPEGKPALGFANGLLLQLLNAKVIVYGLTLYSTFLAALSNRPVPLALSAGVFALVGLISTSAWTLLGSTFTRLLSNPSVRRITAGVLALVLLYSAIDSSGILGTLATT